MKVINAATGFLYRFKCPNCGSTLEAEVGDLSDVGNKVSEFYCPICGKDRYIGWSDLRAKTVFETDTQ